MVLCVLSASFLTSSCTILKRRKNEKHHLQSSWWGNIFWGKPNLTWFMYKFRAYPLVLAGLLKPNTPFINVFISTERSFVILSWYILLPISMIDSSTSSNVRSTLSCSWPFLMTVTLNPFAFASRKASYKDKLTRWKWNLMHLLVIIR